MTHALDVNNTQQMLSPREAAAKLGTTLMFVYHEIASNHFPGARKVNGRWQIPAADVEARAERRRARGVDIPSSTTPAQLVKPQMNPEQEGRACAEKVREHMKEIGVEFVTSTKRVRGHLEAEALIRTNPTWIELTTDRSSPTLAELLTRICGTTQLSEAGKHAVAWLQAMAVREDHNRSGDSK